jgi:hypothetical protein
MNSYCIQSFEQYILYFQFYCNFSDPKLYPRRTGVLQRCAQTIEWAFILGYNTTHWLDKLGYPIPNMLQLSKSSFPLRKIFSYSQFRSFTSPPRLPFARLTPLHLEKFSSILSKNGSNSKNSVMSTIKGDNDVEASWGVLEESELQGWNEDWLKKYKGFSRAIPIISLASSIEE